MSLKHLKTIDFRCLRTAELEADPHYNLIYGVNGSGKTSVLEAIAYLGRGKSFRGAGAQDLVCHGSKEFVLQGKVESEARTVSIGVRNGRGGLAIRFDGDSSAGAAALAEALPLQVVDPEVHSLVAGGPERRRRYLDWMAFHVEQGYLGNWRRFRRTLRQRNAALREAARAEVMAGWDREFAHSALIVHETRRHMLELARDLFEETGDSLLGARLGLEYRQGWSQDMTLEEALAAGLSRDREQGSTQAGPHRGDIRLVLEQRQAKKLVSRGQQKLLSCALILTATELVQNQLERPLLLLLDDPAAELDATSLQRLMACVTGLGCQVIATALVPDKRLLAEPAALFHVEHGVLQRLD